MAEYIFEVSEALYDEQTSEAVMKPNYKGELIRCKDCKHRPLVVWNEAYGEVDVLAPEIDGKEDWRCPCLIDDDPYYSWSPNDNWFCASGERKEYV